MGSLGPGGRKTQQLLLSRVFLQVWRARARRRRPERFKVMCKSVATRPSAWERRLRAFMAVLAVLFMAAAFQISAAAQDQDDPPGRVARLGYMQGSVSFQPAGENEWVEAAPNRPLTTGDKLWADRDSRAEIQLGSSTINLGANTGITFLNLDDRTVQIQLSAGSMNVRIWDLDRDNVFEIDTANQAFTIGRSGRYRVDASENGDSTVVTVREGEGESTGNGQSYTVHSGQRFTFTGTDSLNAEVDQIGRSDDFDNWADSRERRYQDSPSARYCDRRVVGFQDLDEYGDWSPTPDYGYAWFPRVAPGWAPYHTGHWAWIDPWGWTWVDDNPWGYAPFHYGRWAYVRDRWGWIPGPREVRPVYAPALVVFVGGGMAAGSTVAWFPLGPREVYVPSYRVSPAYVNRVNISNTNVNQTTVTNVYNTTIINNNNNVTTINNARYVNRNVNGAVTAVPQRSFASAQPVAQSAVRVNPQQLRAMPVTARAAVPPDRASVLGAHANTAGRVAAPPQAVVNRQVIAKTAPPPPPPSFAAREKLLTQHPGMAVPRQELAKLRPANAPESHVRVAPPARPAQPTPAPARAGQPANGRPGGNPPAANQPGANNRPGNNFPNNRPQPNQPAPNARPEPGGPPARNDRPSAQPNRPEPNQPSNARPEPGGPPARNDRPSAQPNRPEPNQPSNARPEPGGPPARNDRPPSAQPNRPMPNQPPSNARPEPNGPPARNDRPPSAQPNRPDANPSAPNNRPESARPSPPPAREDRPPSARPDNRPDPNQPRPNVPMPAQSQPNMGRPDVNRPEPNRPEPPARSERPSEQPRTEPAPRQASPPADRPQARPDNRPAPQERPQPQREARPAPQDRPQSRPDARPAPPDRPQAQREAPPAKQDQKGENKHH
jgi:hypothetical protein